MVVIKGYLRVRPTGKAWVYRYKEASKEAKLSLGRYPAMSLCGAERRVRKTLLTVPKVRLNISINRKLFPIIGNIKTKGCRWTEIRNLKNS